MQLSPRMIVVLGAVVAGLGVALGAFGAHGLPGMLERWGRSETIEKRLEWFETGVKYHLLHGVAIFALGVLAVADSARRYDAAAWAMTAGIVLFSGSLYLMTVGPDAWRKLGMVTPLGGVAFLAGWTLIAFRAGR